MESNEVRRDLLDVIDVPGLTEDERQARMKRPPKDMAPRGFHQYAEDLIERIEAVENVSTNERRARQRQLNRQQAYLDAINLNND